MISTTFPLSRMKDFLQGVCLRPHSNYITYVSLYVYMLSIMLKPITYPNVRSDFFLVFWWKITKKHLSLAKKVENGQKVFQPAFWYTQHPKADQNTQHLPVTFIFWRIVTVKKSQWHISCNSILSRQQNTQ